MLIHHKNVLYLIFSLPGEALVEGSLLAAYPDDIFLYAYTQVGHLFTIPGATESVESYSYNGEPLQPVWSLFYCHAKVVSGKHNDFQEKQEIDTMLNL